MSEWTRQSVIASLIDEWDVIDSLLSGISEDQWATASGLPGWTVHDIVSHLIGTESLLAGIEAPTDDFDPHAQAHVRNEVAAFNERWVRALADAPPRALLDRFRAVTASRAVDLAAVTDSEWEAITPTPVGPAPYGRFMRIRMFDCWMHEMDVRDALGRPGDEGGLRGELALTEITGAVGFLVGKRAGAPAGSRVTFDLSGPLARRLHVAVNDRATLVESFDESATTTIGMPSTLFTRLCGGRVRADDHRASISIGGDVAVGERIVSSLAFTI
ncbi:uncharacterized protein (TIGR03083 family) [Rhodococcus sp. 27YEA15]|uniref:maleylpyruvate isomerase family mycothiol-dependent enzyme n=1 Tax=Rhodococcus sp. 27YEA15 TaxID=3156259 RepID=UPI003C7AEF98